MSAWLEVTESDLLAQPLPSEVTASVFANRAFHLVLANYGRAPVEITTTAKYEPAGQTASAPTKTHKLEPRSLQILRRSG